MLIQHNGAALNALNNLTKNRSKLSKNLEKLSTGYAINRSGDDAAGLAISEKMRWQVTGITRALDNVKEGEGLIQTGEGALGEVHDMLNRLSSLAEQSANGTYDDGNDRAQLQKELESIREEVGRIADSTNFNGIKLFQDEGLGAERDTASRVMQSDNIRISFTDATETVQTFDFSNSTSRAIKDGDTFTLRATLSDGHLLSCSLTAKVNNATGETRFVDSYGRIVGTQASTVFSSATRGILSDNFAQSLRESSASDSFLFASDGAGKLTATAKVAGSHTPVIVSSGLSHASAGGGGASIKINSTIKLGGDRLPAIRNSSIIPYDGSNAKDAVFSVNGKKFAIGLENTDISDLGADVVFISTQTDTSSAAAGDNGTASAMQQSDLKKIAAEISRGTGLDVLYCPDSVSLADGTAKNTFVFRGYLHDTAKNSAAASSLFRQTSASESIPLSQILADDSPTLKNIIFYDVTDDFTATQGAGYGTVAKNYTGTDNDIADALKGSIVPQAVQAILNKYTAFSYLKGSSLGIGLELYSDANSSTLASVTLDPTEVLSKGALSYKLSVNTADVNLSDPASRSKLEQTICHEMIHAFMDEATTAGMLGIQNTTQNPSYQYPKWFKEGMAQTASGPGNWIRASGGLNLTATSPASAIQAALSGANALSNSSQNAANYGSGYLACMYLGYLASGSSANMNDGASAANKIAEGLSGVLQSLISGKSLDDTIKQITNGAYASTAAFASGFANDAGALSFIEKLLPYVTGTGTAIGGGVVSGNLDHTNPLPDSSLSLNLFQLDKTQTVVSNIYPSEVNILSGGTVSAAGVKPIADPSNVEYANNPFSVSGGTEGTDWKWDKTTGSLQILTAGTYSISKKSGFSGNYTGVIKVADNVGNVNVGLNGVAIDAAKQEGGLSGVDVGSGNKVTLNVAADSSVIGSASSAGIHVGNNSGLTITGSHKLTVTGGTPSSGLQGGAGIGTNYNEQANHADITVNMTGELVATGGAGAAGIGAGYSGSVNNITIMNGTVNATAGAHGAGIGGGWTSLSKVGNITISGGKVRATGIMHGTGIGAGCGGSVGTIKISGNSTEVYAAGGNDGAAIGASWVGKADAVVISGGLVIAKGGERGSGIGSGSSGSAIGKITISGGVINARGSTDSTGIGSGQNGIIEGGVEISGGTITAKGGMTNDGGNIGGYRDRDRTQPTTVKINNPNNLTIKAGDRGEGGYNTTGVTDAGGKPLYAFKLNKDNLKLDSNIEFPIKVTAKDTGGRTYSWDINGNGIGKHKTNAAETDDAIYIWMEGKDVDITIKDRNGNDVVPANTRLTFYDDGKVWRLGNSEDISEFTNKPVYSNDPSAGGDDGGGSGSVIQGDLGYIYSAKGIILQVGTRYEDTLVVPRFYFSRRALRMDEMDISTQEKASKTMGLVKSAINRVSDMRGEYGALQNALGHITNNLGIMRENISSAESLIRDTDVAEEMSGFVKNQILNQSAQSMLAQANGLSQQAVELMRQ